MGEEKALRTRGKDVAGFGAWEEAGSLGVTCGKQGGRSTRTARPPPRQPLQAQLRQVPPQTNPGPVRRSRWLLAPCLAGPPRRPANLLPHPGAPLPPGRRTHDALGHGGRSCLRVGAPGCRRLSPQRPRSPGLGLSPGPGLPPPPPPPLQLRLPAPPAADVQCFAQRTPPGKHRRETRFRAPPPPPRQRPRACANRAAHTSAPPITGSEDVCKRDLLLNVSNNTEKPQEERASICHTHPKKAIAIEGILYRLHNFPAIRWSSFCISFVTSCVRFEGADIMEIF
ncbi:basic proline-rich protein-like [Mesocricetus auratus]|uniref:Basic proline-rich protein-like n=1 Tax=Mesocricetus auratus TaxID=10036 RepID=A0ABM2XY76_MESAU|nr:basic proline-rich protein-like [Mesocricetus auratus]